MDISISIPSLAELVEANKIWGCRCHWAVKGRGTQKSRNCANSIEKNDVRERDALIEQLRLLMQNMKKTTECLSGSAISDTISEIKVVLEKVSKWLLCKGVHRGSHSGAICQQWTYEVTNFEKPRDQQVAQQIRKQFDLGDADKFSCQGRAADGKRCRNLISSKNCSSADAIIEAIAKARNDSPTTRDNVLVLAQLLMCQRYHQVQAVGKSEHWFAIIQALFPTIDTPQEQPSTPPSARSSPADYPTPQSLASIVWSTSDSVSYSTPGTSPPSQRQRTETRASPTTSRTSTRRRTKNLTVIDEPPQTTQTRSMNEDTDAKKSSSLLVVEPYSPKTNILEQLYRKIKKPFGTKDKDPGRIYGFKIPGSDLIKVGFTKDTIKRMKEQRKCYGNLTVVLDVPALHAFRMECLIHATLHQERRQEVLVNGRCNGGKGCSKRHREWVEVKLDKLEDVVRAWNDWFDTKPYDDGILESKWVKHIETLRKTQLMSEVEPWRSWLKIPVAVEKKIATAKKTYVVDDKGHVLVDIQENLDSIAAASGSRIEKLQNDLKKANQSYVDGINQVKSETAGETLLSGYPAAVQNSSLPLGDPFVIPAATTVPA